MSDVENKTGAPVPPAAVPPAAGPARVRPASSLLLVEPDADSGDDAATSPVALAAKRNGVELPVPDADVYPGLMDTARMKEVYRIWMSCMDAGGTVESAAEKAGVSPETALYWAERGDWLQHKRRLLKIRAGEQALDLETKRAAMRTGESMAQIEAAQTLRQKAVEMLSGGDRTVFDKRTGQDKIVSGFSPMELKFIADSLKAGGDVIGRFMGVSEPKPGADAAAAGTGPADDGGQEKSKPLILIVENGGLPRVRAAKPAEVIGGQV